MQGASFGTIKPNHAGEPLKTSVMRLSEFMMLSVEAKKAMVLHTGILIAKRQAAAGPVFLFQLESMYVEIYCNAVTKAVEEYQAFTGTVQLAPYLENIGLDDIL